MTRTRDQVLGTLYGQAIGDALGMPTELWPVETIRQNYPEGITTFVAGAPSNRVAKNYARGEYTDDTGQALAILDSLITTNWRADPQSIVHQILAWADAANAWQLNILGPSSKAALLAVKAGRDPQAVTAQALTNGAAMRIAPVGALFEPQQTSALIKLVATVTKVTHASDVAIGGAGLIAGAVTAAIANYDWDAIVTYALRVCDQAYRLGTPTWAAKLRSRVELGVRLAHETRNEPQRFSRAIYELVGTGTMMSESAAAAIAIAYYTRDVRQCALMCANLGGDTDTIGAMATAICGAKNGVNSIDPAWCRTIDEQNPLHDLHTYADQILNANIN
ncbi:ADP-ribosylglycohydrolase family protein [Lactiplantibacillus garii]|uniref:ADP-ribosylglycohydrolase family protein n=1 Tax=Lactiplantibacillus garii TaxID=2306423 RepID=A0A426D6T3_9LACO|nr:ADP-ribosylglycohydrolase family protein [Lactiplantibacillus garii]RRK10324.1 ADP-ribosylglycohydrolase family protein [Lactiplantibacillus garii]